MISSPAVELNDIRVVWVEAALRIQAFSGSLVAAETFAMACLEISGDSPLTQCSEPSRRSPDWQFAAARSLSPPRACLRPPIHFPAGSGSTAPGSGLTARIFEEFGFCASPLFSSLSNVA
jgi:hypothetical protein